MVPEAVCIAPGHKEQKIKFIFWTSKENKCYFDAEHDEIINKLIIWTPKTVQQQAVTRGFWSRKTKITQRCLRKILQLALTGINIYYLI